MTHGRCWIERVQKTINPMEIYRNYSKVLWFVVPLPFFCFIQLCRIWVKTKHYYVNYRIDRYIFPAFLQYFNPWMQSKDDWMARALDAERRLEDYRSRIGYLESKLRQQSSGKLSDDDWDACAEANDLKQVRVTFEIPSVFKKNSNSRSKQKNRPPWWLNYCVRSTFPHVNPLMTRKQRIWVNWVLYFAGVENWTHTKRRYVRINKESCSGGGSNRRAMETGQSMPHDHFIHTVSRSLEVLYTNA